MSWLLTKRKNGKYGWWTTVSDGWMTKLKYLPRDEMVEMIVKLKRKHFNKEMRELRKTFPKGWYDKDTHQELSNNK